MDMDKAFPSLYLSASDCEDEDLVLTITDVKLEKVGMGRDAADKPVVYFEEVEKGLILNKPNKETIKGFYGKNSADWEGKRIGLYATEVEYQGKMSMGIRVRLKAPRTKAAKPSKAEAATVITNPDAAADDDLPF